MSQQYPPQYDGQPLQQSSYPQQQPMYPAPGQQLYPPQVPVSPTKKPKRWPWIIALVVVFFIGVGVGSGVSSGSHSNTTTTTTNASTTQPGGGTSAQPTTAPTKAAIPAKWTTTQTFTGTGAKKTATFAVGNDWKILYTCSGMSIGGMTSDANLIVGVYNSDGSMADPAAINTICKAGKTTTDNTEEHQSGNVYLDVNAEGDWTVHVQELK